VVRGEDVLRLARTLPRTEVAMVRDRMKFRVRGIVYAALSPDETVLGVGYPREERAALVAAEPHRFSFPRPSDMRFHWVHCQLDQIDHDEMYELVVDAWRMVVPKFVARDYAASVQHETDGG
jgi:hypothetical protein